MNEWWTSEQAGVFGAIAGSSLGILGGVIGTSVGIFANKGMFRRFNYALIGAVLAVCIASLLSGVFAVIDGQPYHVWYPLVLIGAIGCFSLSGVVVVIPRIYRAAEHRRIEAESLRRA